MRCLTDPELSSEETALVRRIYGQAATTLTRLGHLPGAAFFRVGPRVALPNLKLGDIAVLKLDIPGHDAGKDALVAMLRVFAQQADACLAVLLLESWMITPNAEKAKHIREHGEFLVRPSHHPERIEIVLVSVSKPGGHNWSAWAEIQRSSLGIPSIAPELPALEYLTCDGRFANILDEDASAPSPS